MEVKKHMRIIVDNLAVEYQDEGTGLVMLFLHGWKDTLHTFDALVPLLTSTSRVIMLDLPGFGKSEMPKESWNLDDYVRFVMGFNEKLRIHPDVLVGHSFGGRIILKGVASKRLHAKKIVLIGAAGIAKRRSARNTALAIVAKIGKLFTVIPPLVFWRKHLRRKLYKIIGSDYYAAGALRQTFLRIIAEDLRSCAKGITVPTLLLWGSNDTETPLTDGKELSTLIANSRLRVLSGTGHFVHQEKPKEVAALIRESV